MKKFNYHKISQSFPHKKQKFYVSFSDKLRDSNFFLRFERFNESGFVMPWARSCQIQGPLKEIVLVPKVLVNVRLGTSDLGFLKE